ncbi:hydroxymethylbilane synthase [Desulfurispira natronophila]|uniref:Porphobilinogen deaminase n=1 Tax=Desulfurispira natronophila TaxID=682562 RepID=A0A7W7Y6P4_9BACT|nr:hydroxymethylbilane synthase [Desulfurispira natronophila]MBB5022737.1 hydroxymethylbilane synthase [Desulfurispira natronophila]
MKITIGTRASKLALWQAEHIKAEIEGRYSDVEVVLKKIVTKGDKILDSPLAKVGGKGLFVKEIENELISGEIDIAVHSMKDVPTEFPDGLELFAITYRGDPRDAFVSAHGKSLAELSHKEDVTIGTSSLRRQAQLLIRYSHWNIVWVRGNVQTRLKRMEERGMDGIILAAAGLQRLELEHLVQEYIDPEVMVPAIGQGALGLEIRSADNELKEKLKFLIHPETTQCVLAERALLRTMEGGCQVPIGAYATMTSDGQVHLKAMVGSVDGKTVVRRESIGNDPEVLGIDLANEMLDAGARAILQEVYQDHQ